MIHRSARALANLWATNKVICPHDVEAYQYGLELLFSTFINLLLVVCIALASGHAWQFVPYLMVFIPLRIFAGGYHAKNHALCIASNAFLFLAVLELSELASPAFFVITSAISFALVILYAPVPARNKPLSSQERKRGRFISIVFSALLLVAAAVLAYGKLLDDSAIKMAFGGQWSAALLMTLERVTSYGLHVFGKAPAE